MQISKDMKFGILKLSQEQYIKKVLERFSVGDAKPWNTPLARNTKLLK